MSPNLSHVSIQALCDRGCKIILPDLNNRTMTILCYEKYLGRYAKEGESPVSKNTDIVVAYSS
jgi:hypothetical protein